ncbi:MAG: 3-oxoacyl-ACP synthase III [bacterium]|nr:3-oxoacyl-ACP synthase III [bacterium]
MKYSKVFIEAIAYELAPVVVSSEELEERLEPLYQELHMSGGQLEALTGIEERRWWHEGYALSDGAIAAAGKAINASRVGVDEIEAVVYTGVGREHFEPATACRVADELGVAPTAVIHDISNACLGMLSGIVDVANRIELGQLRAGLVVSCETARDIVEEAIRCMLESQTMELFASSVATLTGGSGAAAILLTDGSFGPPISKRKKLLGGCIQAAPKHHGLCRWGMTPRGLRTFKETMRTDAPSVMKYGVELGVRTWLAFLDELGWTPDDVDKVICHQVGSSNQTAVLEAMDIPLEKDFATYPYLGNIGTVSLPLTAALADERGFLRPGDRVGFLGIGSGLNCMMLGVEW